MLDRRSLPKVFFRVVSSTDAAVVVDVVSVVDVVVVVDPSAFCFTFGTKCDGARSEVEKSFGRDEGDSGFVSGSCAGFSVSTSDSLLLLLFLPNFGVNRFPFRFCFPPLRSSSAGSSACSVACSWSESSLVVLSSSPSLLLSIFSPWLNLY